MALPYTLTENQAHNFRDVCDLYRPNTTIELNGYIEKVSYGPTADFENIPVQQVSKSESSVPEVMGRSDKDIVMTTDVFRFHSSQEIDDNWYMQLKTSGHPEEGIWLIAQGGVKVHIHRAQTVEVFFKRSTKPPGVP